MTRERPKNLGLSRWGQLRCNRLAMMSIAALTSAISMIEATLAYLNEQHGISRLRAAMASGVVLLVISLLAMLPFNLRAGWTPLGGIFMVVLAGYVLRGDILRDELNLPPAGYAL